MSALSIVLYLVAAAAGWLVRHYQTPAHHKIVDAALKDQAEAKAKDMVASLFTPPAPPPDPAKK